MYSGVPLGVLWSTFRGLWNTFRGTLKYLQGYSRRLEPGRFSRRSAVLFGGGQEKGTMRKQISSEGKILP